MFGFRDLKSLIGKNINSKDIKEISNLVGSLESKVNSKYGEQKNKIIKKCMIECIKAHNGNLRKTGGLYTKHPLEMSLNALKYNIDYITLGGILLHDVVEELVDKEILESYGELSKKNKNKVRVRLRDNELNRLSNTFSDFLKIEDLYTHKYVEDTKELISLVSKISRYKTERQTYYEYLKNLFSEKFIVKGKKVSKKDIERAIVIKLLDRNNNIETMYYQSEKPDPGDLEIDYKKLIDTYHQNKLKYLIIKRKKHVGLKNSIRGQKKLYGIWKNIYLINQTKRYLNKSRKSSRTKKICKILEDVISTTLYETKLNKKILRLDKSISVVYSRSMDKEILMYQDIGGLEKITNLEKNNSDMEATIRLMVL